MLACCALCVKCVLSRPLSPDRLPFSVCFLATTPAGMWALDPIDGTKGFLRGGQYAVCLALLVDGQIQLGVMGCPNLPLDASKPDGTKGAIFVAVKGQGAFQVSGLTNQNHAPRCVPRAAYMRPKAHFKRL